MPDTTEFVIFRATREKYALLLDGFGAAQSSHNRWNDFGQRVVYAASSRALALLELRVHSPWGPPPDTVISVIRIELPENHIYRINASALPDGWRDPVDVRHCQIRGSR